MLVSVSSNSSENSILTSLNKRVREALRQGGGAKAQEDGMDITICRISKDMKDITIASANQLAYYIEKGSQDFKIIESDIYSII
jgi:hypothetical protein